MDWHVDYLKHIVYMLSVEEQCALDSFVNGSWEWVINRTELKA